MEETKYYWINLVIFNRIHHKNLYKHNCLNLQLK